MLVGLASLLVPCSSDRTTSPSCLLAHHIFRQPLVFVNRTWASRSVSALPVLFIAARASQSRLSLAGGHHSSAPSARLLHLIFRHTSSSYFRFLGSWFLTPCHFDSQLLASNLFLFAFFDLHGFRSHMFILIYHGQPSSYLANSICLQISQSSSISTVRRCRKLFSLQTSLPFSIFWRRP